LIGKQLAQGKLPTNAIYATVDEMKSKRLWLLAILLLVMGIAFVDWGSFGRLSDFDVGVAGDGKLNVALERIRDEEGVPALAVMLIRDGKVVESGAVGVRALGLPERVTIGDRWHLGSITKSMTATLAAILVEQGTIGWDTTVGEVFPDLAETTRPEYSEVRLEELLTHTSGLPEKLTQIPSLSNSSENTTPLRDQRRQWTAKLLAVPPETPRGTHLYSNASYVVAGSMLEAVTGQQWEDLMRQHVFTPLGMTSTGFGAPGTVGESPDEPRGHRRVEGKLRPLQPNQKADNPPAVGPAGIVHTTLADFAHFTVAHLAGSRGQDGLVTATTFKKLHTPAPGTKYALGWNIRKHSHSGGRVLYHHGSNRAWYATVWLAPERNFAIVIFTNAGDDAGQKAADVAIQAVTDRCNAAFN
jgi:CubicO group peptidase (beta-lactamase class C family)